MKNVESIIEAILFAKGEAISLSNISYVIQKTTTETKTILDNMILKYADEKRGIQIIQVDDSYQMCTSKDYYDYVKKMYSTQKKKTISKTLLETLAIVAYKQPITKSQIENIRGVSCEHAINSLIKYELIEEKGRLDAIGRPILFGTTDYFLKYFGFSSLENMPKVESDENIKIQIEKEILNEN